MMPKKNANVPVYMASWRAILQGIFADAHKADRVRDQVACDVGGVLAGRLLSGVGRLIRMGCR